ncbi:MAG: thiamine-phosphate kinase [Nitriliruptorales bacterium]|nr:thiamine-phosphate kinase [Nitriliruptorales bacterium]
MRERDVLCLVQERFGSSPPGVAVGPGDDAAVLVDGTVITTDTVADGVHVDRRWSSLEDVGWKAVHAAVSDIPAMGARPTAAVVSAQLTGGMAGEDVAALLDGVAEGAAAAGVPIVGGDVTSSNTMALTVTVLGRLLGDQPCARSGAAVGDLVGVIGHVGRAAAGLALHQAAAGQADRVREAHPQLSEAHRRPHALVGAAGILADPGVTAGIDVSDGLGRDLGHVAAASGVQVLLEALPPDPLVDAAAAALDVTARDLVLGGGDDHALAITIDPAAVERIKGAVAALDLPFAIVGTVRGGSGVLHDGEDVAGLGWEHR